MIPNSTYHRLKLLIVFLFILAGFGILMGRLGYLMVFRSAHYTALAKELHERERSIKAARGRICDRNGVVIADNRDGLHRFRDSQPDHRCRCSYGSSQ